MSFLQFWTLYLKKCTSVLFFPQEAVDMCQNFHANRDSISCVISVPSFWGFQLVTL